MCAKYYNKMVSRVSGNKYCCLFNNNYTTFNSTGIKRKIITIQFSATQKKGKIQVLTLNLITYKNDNIFTHTRHGK